MRCPSGFTAAGCACGIKAGGAPDLALIRAAEGTTAAAVFTTNRLQAAPITVSRRHLASTGGRAAALLVNAGCANAATGPDGMRRAEATTAALAAELGCPPERVLVNSTGLIGSTLPDDRIRAALPALVAACGPDGLPDAAAAIMTTDTRPKLAAAGRAVGIAKGSGMIHPDMATMIAVLLTDAPVEAARLDALLRAAVDRSFHRISVDGDTSTNDAVFALASGMGPACAEGALAADLTAVARDLAEQVVRDGEGAQRLLRVRVTGAADGAAAATVARTVAGSLLVRTAVTGGDPNWGRILAAVGRSGVDVDLDRVVLRAGGARLYADGAPVAGATAAAEAAFAADEVELHIDLRSGAAEDEFLTCDLTQEYVRINAEYST